MAMAAILNWRVSHILFTFLRGSALLYFFTLQRGIIHKKITTTLRSHETALNVYYLWGGDKSLKF